MNLLIRPLSQTYWARDKCCELCGDACIAVFSRLLCDAPAGDLHSVKIVVPKTVTSKITSTGGPGGPLKNKHT